MKKADQITALEYTVEALEEEVAELLAIVSEKQRHIVELITENDRLTLTYEPYEPPRTLKERGRVKKWLHHGS